METYHKIQTLFKRDMDGSLTGKKGKMMEGAWTTPELEYLADKQWEFTEKVDGTNIRIELRLTPDGNGGNVLSAQYAGRTDNAVIPKPLLEHLEAIFPTLPMWRRELSQPAYSQRWMELLNWMQDSDLESVILFGEGYGPKIQGGGKYREDHSFVLFDVRIGNFWLTRDNVDDIASKLGIDSVPVIGHGTLYEAIDRVATHHQSYHGLLSRWGDFEAEGIVARPAVPLFDRKGDRIITKIKGVDFK